MKNNRIGVVHGRFQPFHNDHLKYVMESFKYVDYVLIGITNPDSSLMKYDEADKKRSNNENNPYTFFERLTMIKQTLLEKGLDQKNFDIVPFPINIPKLIKYYAPKDAIYFITIYDEWGKRKKELLKEVDLNVKVLWERPINEKGINATDIRAKIKKGADWENLVPNAVYKFITRLN